ncbi:MAG: helicase C-terminal domain-containing protein [Anaerolineae bacterium]|nr:helicase C-terminal domain-containing protein [Anaerolineae bacterium]
MQRTYVALDLETTGLDTERDSVIEIGAVKFRSREVLSTWSSLVNPSRPIPYRITQLTGIREEDVRGAPALASVLADLVRFVGNATIVGHSVQFDLAFLAKQGVLTNAEAIDTFELASILVPHAPRYSLDILAQTLGVPAAVHHRALDDAQTAMNLFNVLLERALALDVRLLEEIVRLTERSQWSLRHLFRDVLAYKGRSAFVAGSLGQQVQSKVGDDAYALGLLMLREDEEAPLRPTTRKAPVDVDRVAQMLEEGGDFARRFPHFEHRPQQVAMLRAVARSLNEGHHLLVEAGTGTGKSLAYLLPAMHFALQNERPVVISTNTINLQEQLYTKDIPDIQKVLDLDVRVALLKGRSNYLCLRRLTAMRARDNLSEDELRVLAKVLIWQQTTATGDVTELFLPTPQERAVWSQISSEQESCLAEDCPHRQKGRCFFYRARRRAERAHIIIVNHALLMSDVAVENRVLPEYKYLIVDEAHHFEDATTRQLSFQADRAALDRQLAEISQRVSAGRYRGFLTDVAMRCRNVLPGPLFRDLERLLDDVRKDVDLSQRTLGDFFAIAEEFLTEHANEADDSGYSQRLRITPGVRAQPAWNLVEMAWQDCATILTRLDRGLQQLGQSLEGMDDYEVPELDAMLQDLAAHILRLRSARDHIGQIVFKPSDNQICWLERNTERGILSLNAAPLRVGDLVRQHIFSQKEAVILTSATLCVGGKFDYMRDRLGAWDAEELAVGSPFDYKASTLVYVPLDMPELHEPYYQRNVEEALVQLCTAMGGRTLVLFTSYSQLRATARAISKRLAEEDILVLEHGDGGSRQQLLTTFRETPRAVLLGTRSFWEGIDVMGEALSCLVIARLPFAVPTEPIFAARSETFEDPFNQYAVPESVLRFRQGFGRLIRSRTDRGVFVVLDKRIISKAYGRMFLDSLPNCTVRKGSLTELAETARQWVDGLAKSPSRTSASED